VCLKPNKQTVRSTRTSLTFSSTALTRKFLLSLANNAEITAEDIYEVPVGACADGTSVSTLCASSQNSPAGNTVLYHLRTKFEPERLERVANTLLRKDLDELLPEQVEVCADLHLRPYYGDEDDTDGLYHSVAKRGTTAFHAYATLSTRVKNKRYTLAVRRLKDGDTASSVLAEFFSVSSTALTPGSRPSTLIADSTTVSVSRCFRRTITRT